jgi:uncharacterized protein YbjT (DUF2867 family)
MSQKSALLAGASGLVGGHCLKQLLAEESYSKVIAIVRRPLPITHITDFSDLGILGETLSADDVYCCLGTTIKKAGTQEAFCKVDFDYPVKLAALTQHCGAKQFLIVTSIGADPHSRIFYGRVKGETEEALARISFEALHIFRPSLLLGNREEHRAGEKAGAVVMSAIKNVMVGPFKKYRPIQANDVAKAMVCIAQKDLKGINIFESQRIQEIADSAGAFPG